MSSNELSEILDQLSFDNYGLDSSHVLEIQSSGSWSHGEVTLECSCGLLDLVVFPLIHADSMKRHYREDIRTFIEENGILSTMPENFVFGDAEYILGAILHHSDQIYVDQAYPANFSKEEIVEAKNRKEDGDHSSGISKRENYNDVVLATDANARFPKPYSPEKDILHTSQEMNRILSEFTNLDKTDPSAINQFANALAIESERAAASETRAKIFRSVNPELFNEEFNEEKYEEWLELMRA